MPKPIYVLDVQDLVNSGFFTQANSNGIITGLTQNASIPLGVAAGGLGSIDSQLIDGQPLVYSKAQRRIISLDFPGSNMTLANDFRYYPKFTLDAMFAAVVDGKYQIDFSNVLNVVGRKQIVFDYDSTTGGGEVVNNGGGHYTWTPPAGLTSVLVKITGPGGNGGNGGTTYTSGPSGGGGSGGGGSGGSGAYSERLFDINPTHTYTIVVGNNGVATAFVDNGTTVLAATPGGNGGNGGVGTPYAGGAAGAAGTITPTPSPLDVYFPGLPGMVGQSGYFLNNFSHDGDGGIGALVSSYFYGVAGSKGVSSVDNSNVAPGAGTLACGGGGSAGSGSRGPTYAGAAGGAGRLILVY